jgi:hypothetical protein
VGPTTGLYVMEKRNISCSCRESNPGCPVRSLSLYRLSYPGSRGGDGGGGGGGGGVVILFSSILVY